MIYLSFSELAISIHSYPRSSRPDSLSDRSAFARSSSVEELMHSLITQFRSRQQASVLASSFAFLFFEFDLFPLHHHAMNRENCSMFVKAALVQCFWVSNKRHGDMRAYRSILLRKQAARLLSTIRISLNDSKNFICINFIIKVWTIKI